jgi:aminotransferase
MSKNLERFVNKNLKNIRESPISELLRKAGKYKNVISLGRGEPDFNLPDFLKKAMIQAIKNDKSHYAATGSIPELNEEIFKKLKKENKLNVDSDNIVIGTGSSPVLQASIAAITNPGDRILLTDPTYMMYISLIKSIDREYTFVPVLESNGFVPTFEDLKKAYRKNTKAIVINFPSNPTGAVCSKKSLKKIADFAVEKDLIIISDEIYEKIIYGDWKYCSIGSLNGMKNRVITINGFSKAYAMTGLRVGYAAGPKEIMKHVYKYNYFAHICPTVPSLYVALEAMKNPKSKGFVNRQVKEYDRRRKFIVKTLNDMGIDTPMPKGAFYVFANFSHIEKDSYKMAYRILDEAKVITTPGVAFGPHGEGFLRFSYATKYEEIKEAMQRIEKTLK